MLCERSRVPHMDFSDVTATLETRINNSLAPVKQRIALIYLQIYDSFLIFQERADSTCVSWAFTTS